MEDLRECARPPKSRNQSGPGPTKIDPKPLGTPEEREAWADQGVKKTVENMRKLPENFIPRY